MKKKHIKPYHTFYCWPVVSLLLKNGRPYVKCSSHDVSLCCLAHDVMTFFKTHDLFKMAAALLEAPLSPEEAVLKLKCLVISQTYLPLRIQDERMSRENYCHFIYAYICCYRCSSIFDRALIHARPTGNKQVT